MTKKLRGDDHPLYPDYVRAWREGDLEAAERLEAARDGLRDAGDSVGLAWACLGSAMVAWRVHGDFERALALLDQATNDLRFEAAPDAWMRLYNFVGFIHISRGRWVDALPPLLALRRRGAAPTVAEDMPTLGMHLAQANGNLGFALAQLGDVDVSERLVRLASELEQQDHRHNYCASLAIMALERGDVRGAREVLPPAPDSNDRRDFFLYTVAIAGIELAEGDAQGALEKIQVLRSLDWPVPDEQGSACLVAAQACLALGRFEEAVAYTNEGIEILSVAPGSRDTYRLIQLRARVQHQLGDYDAVLEAVTGAIDRQQDHRRRTLGRALVDMVVHFDDEIRHLHHVEIEAQRQALVRANHELNEARQRAEAALAEHRSLEEQLKRTAMIEAVGQMAGGLAHDLNNLLTVVYASVGTLQELPRNPSERDLSDAHLAVEDISVAAERATQLVRRLLLLSRRSSHAKGTSELGRSLHDARSMLRRLLPETLELELELDADGVIGLEATQLEQVVINLVLNARDAIAGPGRIVLKTSQEGQSLLLDVCDNGPGIDPSLQAHVFEPFFTTKALGKGSGLGLAVCRTIVEEAEGSIELLETGPSGTTLRVRLPRTGAPVAEVPLSTSSEMRRVSARTREARSALLAEDNDAVRATVAQTLTSAGYDVVVAAHGAEALDAFRRQPWGFHVVVTDIVMPQMSGVELAHAVRELRADVPIVLISGYAEDPELARLLDEDGVSFLAKPFAPGALVRAVEAVIA